MIPTVTASPTAFQQDFAAAGGAQTTRITYTPDPPDLSSEVARLSADVASLSASGKTAVFCVCFLGDAQKALQLSLVDPILSEVDWIGNEAMTAPDILEDASVASFLQNANFVSVGSYSGTKTPLVDRFVASFTERYENPPGPFTNYAFDAAKHRHAEHAGRRKRRCCRQVHPAVYLRPLHRHKRSGVTGRER